MPGPRFCFQRDAFLPKDNCTGARVGFRGKDPLPVVFLNLVHLIEALQDEAPRQRRGDY